MVRCISSTSTPKASSVEVIRGPESALFGAEAGRLTGERQDADFTFGVTRNPGHENIYASASYQAARHITQYLSVDNLPNERYEEVLGYPGALARR